MQDKSPTLFSLAPRYTWKRKLSMWVQHCVCWTEQSMVQVRICLLPTVRAYKLLFWLAFMKYLDTHGAAWEGASTALSSVPSSWPSHFIDMKVNTCLRLSIVKFLWRAKDKEQKKNKKKESLLGLWFLWHRDWRTSSIKCLFPPELTESSVLSKENVETTC